MNTQPHTLDLTAKRQMIHARLAEAGYRQTGRPVDWAWFHLGDVTVDEGLWLSYLAGMLAARRSEEDGARLRDRQVADGILPALCGSCGAPTAARGMAHPDVVAQLARMDEDLERAGWTR